MFARLLAQKLSAKLGQQFYVENQAGAGGNLGMGNAARAAPDGYSIVFVSTSFIVNPSLFAKIPYDPYKDFAPVTLAAVSPNLLSIHPSIPAKNVKELVAFLKANPGKYSFASAGLGTTPHLSGELFKLSQQARSGACPVQRLGARDPVGAGRPYADRLHVITPAVPQVKAGTLRGLAVTDAEALARAAGRADAWPKPGCPIRRPTRCRASWCRPARRRRSSTSCIARSSRRWRSPT